MDPDEYLGEMLEIARKIQKAEEPVDEDEVDRFADLFLELNTWISGGGCPPTDWEPER